MESFVKALLDPRYMPHGHCYFWQPELVWLQVVSNLVIGLSYVSISLTLLMLTRRVKGLPFHVAFLAFGLFIVSCGLTHFLDVVTVWKGVYWLDGTVRAFTALCSALTALWLFPLFPTLVASVEAARAERAMSRRDLEAALTAERTARASADALASEVAEQARLVQLALDEQRRELEQARARIAELEADRA